MQMKLDEKYFKEGSGFNIPAYQSEMAAAVDLQSDRGGVISPESTMIVGTGVRLNMSDNPNMAALILPRSSLGMKGLIISNTIGLIDPDYQGELKIGLWNRTKEELRFDAGERVAQLMFIPIMRPRIEYVSEFSNTTVRGENGFGSTGK